MTLLKLLMVMTTTMAVMTTAATVPMAHMMLILTINRMMLFPLWTDDGDDNITMMMVKIRT